MREPGARTVGDVAPAGRERHEPDPAVLHLITTTARRGAETVAVGLNESLRSRGLAGRVVALVAAEDGYDVPVLGARRLGASTLAALRREMRQARVVVAHGSTTLPASVLAGTGLQRPVLYRNIGDPRFWASSPVRRWRSSFMLRRVAGVVAITETAADRVHEVQGVSRSAITVVPTSVDETRFAPTDDVGRQQLRTAWGLRPDRPTVAVLGALSPEKGVGVAIEALAEIPEAQLLIAGDGPDRPTLEALATRRAPDRVIFAGATDRPEDVLAAADVLMLPSLTEGVPAVALEAGLAAVPVVASDVGFVADVVLDGVTGLLVPPEEPAALAAGVRTALASRDRLGIAARDHLLQHHSTDVVADAWAELLTRFVDRNGS